MKNKLTLLVLSLVMIVVAGCASAGYQKKGTQAANLSGFVAASGLVEQGDNCLLVANLKNGRTVQTEVKKEVCDDAKSALDTVNAFKAAEQEAQRRAVEQVQRVPQGSVPPGGAVPEQGK